jgi:superfamily II DNA or RNA helicase
MNTKLSRNGYTIIKSEINLKELKKIKDDLTAKPFTINDFGTKNEVKFNLYLESPKKLYMPRFYGYKKFGDPKINKLTEGEKINIKFNGSLRKEQEPIYDIAYKQIIETGGGIISLKCGGGKTVLSLYLAYKLGYKIIVLVHKDFLMTQWYDRIQEFLPDAKIGKIQQNTIDIEEKDIVLAMVQSISMKEYDQDIFNTFGTAIFDECHHLGAEVFCKCMRKTACTYMIGLSATPNRKDGLRWVFESYIGNIAYKSKDKNEDYVEVKIINYDVKEDNYCKEELTYQKKPCCPKMINNICEYLPRTYKIIDELINLKNEGRSILILSDRRGHLSKIHELLKEKNIDSGFYIGGMKPHDLRISQEKDIILGTFSMASEGMDIPKLNTIILGSPKSDIIQSVGRILRQKKESRKFHPLIIDINDNFSLFANQSKKRLLFYSKNNYDITYYNLDGTNYKYEKKINLKKKKQTLNLEECLL